MSRFSARNFDVNIMGVMIHVESASATISDESEVTLTRGVTDGHTDGVAKCDVEYEVDLHNFRKLEAKAKEAGSWRGIKPHDCMFYANNGEAEDKVELFGVKLLLDELLSLDPSSKDKTKRKLKGFVTSPHFVKVNGVPYLSPEDTRGLI